MKKSNVTKKVEALKKSSGMKVLRDIDNKHEQRKWSDMTPLEKTVAYVKHQRWWLLTWLCVPVALPAYALYNGWLYGLYRLAPGKGRNAISINGLRAHVPNIVTGAFIWLTLYLLLLR